MRGSHKGETPKAKEFQDKQFIQTFLSHITYPLIIRNTSS